MKKILKRVGLLLVLLLCLGVGSFGQNNQNVTVQYGIQIGPSHQATLNWTASVTAGVTSYNIYRSVISGSAYVKISSVSAPNVTFTDIGLPAGATFYYVVTAVSPGAESTFSNQGTGVIPTP